MRQATRATMSTAPMRYRNPMASVPRQPNETPGGATGPDERRGGSCRHCARWV